MCQKASQPDGSDLSVSAQGWEGAQARWSLPRGFQAAQPQGRWASALTPEILGEAGVAAAGRPGDACCSSSSAISVISLRADLLALI